MRTETFRAASLKLGSASTRFTPSRKPSAVIFPAWQETLCEQETYVRLGRCAAFCRVPLSSPAGGIKCMSA